ncbi:hypothetical protein A3Q56_00739 [Intoshia linei]|uniref:polynucleotide adenylyltransferase n=1 Tax=Intoshia linei TaxID=1819745 RepID=A0A177BD80_9BILA|nr:hypothetical protein A3Q56_00739 [Intoshia linei]
MNLVEKLTEPINKLESSENEVDHSHNLLEFVKNSNHFVQASDSIFKSVPKIIDDLYIEWIECYREYRYIPKYQDLLCSTHLIGSYGLDVLSRDSDIDILCVASKEIKRNDFFTKFAQYIEDNLDCNLNSAAVCYVPVINMAYKKIKIDIVFSQVTASIPKNEQSLDAIKTISNSAKCERTINAYRNLVYIKMIAPNFNKYRNCVKVVKMWAKNKLIYSNCVGYLGGIAWYILVLKVMLLYPNATCCVIFEKVLYYISHRDWNKPVSLVKFHNENSFKNRKRGANYMTIFTPILPHQNTAYNVTESSKVKIIREAKKALSLVVKILHGYANVDWEMVLRPQNFFENYQFYIMIRVISMNLKYCYKWQTFVYSRLRNLIELLDGTKYIKEAHTYPKRLMNINHPFQSDRFYFVGIEIDKDLYGSMALLDLNIQKKLFLSGLSGETSIDPTKVSVKFDLIPKERIDSVVACLVDEVKHI